MEKRRLLDFPLAEITDSRLLPANSPVIAATERSERGRVYQALIGHPWAWDTALSIANAASPNPEKQGRFGTEADWILAAERRGEFLGRLRPMHQQGLGKTWDYMEQHLPALYRPLPEKTPEFNERLGTTPLSPSDVSAEIIAQLRSPSQLGSARKDIRQKIMRACMERDSLKDALEQKIRRSDRRKWGKRRERMISQAHPRHLQFLAEADAAAFEESLVESLVSGALYVPYGQSYLQGEWSSRIEKGEFTKEKGRWQARYVRDDPSDGSSVSFRKEQLTIAKGTMALLAWRNENGERTWSEQRDQRCPEDIANALAETAHIRFTESDQFANPLAGLMVLGAENPDTVSRWPHTMTLPGSTVQQRMTTAQAPGLVHMFQKQLLRSAFMQRLEDRIDTQA